ncbi:MAG: isoprenyl transferase [Candidatus Omnitrophica bacterium]|nr:isoprenyl transferase [Candidatus Omnitrophota bacterium]
MNNLPRHIAIIMDGNGRWAHGRNLPRIVGHREGIKTVRRIVEAAVEIKLQVLTLYAFSVENWNRSPREVDALMKMLPEFLEKETPDMMRNNIRFRAIGRISGLPLFVQTALDHTRKTTQNNQGLTLALALNYGGRTELVDAVKSVAREIAERKLLPEEINEDTIEKHLYTFGLPDPDLLIRTSGEMRISNFLLWQISYTEIYVTKKFWPDFTKEDFFSAINDYQQRERRFGRDSMPAQVESQ